MSSVMDSPTVKGSVEERMQEFLKNASLFYAPDPEIMTYHGLAPRTEFEEEALAKQNDPAKLSIVRDRMQACVDEAFDMLANIASAPGAKWGDMITALYTSSGDLTLASTGGVVIFSNLVQYSTKFINKYWTDEPTVGVREGDIFMHNDARYGAPHNADQTINIPLFHEGKLVAWIGAVIHEGECGAIEPGGVPGTAETIWDEGMKLSPTKVGENYELKRDLVTFFQNSVRDPKLQLADMKAKLFVCMRMEQRLKETISEFGVDVVVAALRGNLEDTRAEVKRRLKEWPDGTVRHYNFTDHTLRESIVAKMNLQLTKKDDRLIFDYRGSAPEFTNRSNNSLTITCKGMLSQLFLTYIWPDLPRNQAVVGAMEFVFDEGSVLTPTHETPNAQSMQTLFHAWACGAVCVMKYIYSIPDKYTRFMSPWHTMINTFHFGGLTKYGEPIANIAADINGMSGGAKADRDGEHAMAPFFATMADIGEQELTEEDVPFIQLISKKILKDNQSFGKFRGGQGYQMAITMRGSDSFGFQCTAQGSKIPNTQGLFGAYAVPAYPLMKIEGVNIYDIVDKKPELMRYTVTELMNDQPFEGATYTTTPMALPYAPVGEGEIFMMTQGAGGGYGDALDRDPAHVMKDLEEDLISHDVAWRIFKVVYNEETLIVDEEATEKARADERKARVSRSKPFDEFVGEWVTDAPPAHLPYYGCWADPGLLFGGSPDVKGAPGELPPTVMPDPKDVEIARLQAQLNQLAAE